MNLQLGELDMSDTLWMFGRYSLAIATSYAVGKGWITPTGGDALTSAIIEIAAVVAAYAPAIYAGIKVNNSPKP
jgi:hypothetical protein